MGVALRARRHEWADLPPELIAAVADRTGPIVRVDSTSAGYSSQLAATLDTASGRVFVKGMRTDHADRWTQDVEAAIGPYLAPLAPRVLWRVVADGWDLIGFEHIAGRGADYGPASADLPLAVEGITAIGRLARPGIRLRTARARWGRYLDDPSDAAAFAGDTVVHSDMNPSNMLLTGANTVRMVDWPWVTRGAAWIDAACWVVWLVYSGHPPHAAEQWAARVPGWAGADPDAIDLFAVAQTRYWQATVDAHTNRMTMALRTAASRWALHRGMWP
ncbi:aminoglycoside phosphotransferase [Kibdelosporangium persicum]|uniref:Aminoglycoside phosphotransferase n=1 Tax=Kibdelosporangium persicum TaxID=2698649 RepID=A0ABX2EZD6_9PSEU|nr:aminoglycoside phosphotransferase [Kibdelosporangium persicum]NRN64416.1 Aminoglycoside phosphotransferase [Kibdelosporangium persicum]